MELIVGIFDGAEICFYLLHVLSGLHWWEVYHEPHRLGGCVLVVPSMTRIASFCILPSFSRLVSAIVVRLSP